MSLVSLIASLGLAVSSAAAVPNGFPVSGNGLWYTEPAVNWSTQYLPIGNGYLGAMINGNPTSDRIQLNIESLWSGGPFADPNYNGGNHPASGAGYLATELARIRKTIFSSSNGTIADVRPLPYDGGAYGSYSGAGYLNVNRTASGKVTNYARWLDMDTAVLKTTWTEPVGSFNRSYFCSNPSRACTVHTASSTPGALSATFSFSSLEGLPAREITCLDSTTIQLRGHAASPGMLYEILAKIQQSGPANSTAGCAVDAASGDAVLFTKGSTQAWVNWVGGTEYSMETGNAASGYSFKGVDPHAGLVSLLAKAAKQTVGAALTAHIADYRSALGGFSLDLGQKFDTTKTTADLWSTYKIDVGNPYIEWLMFNYGRYMLVGSTRSYLPANLQGKWARDAGAPWSGDYHANINVQMNYWFAEMTNMKVTSSLWDYMAKTWAPRGAETARTLYNVTRGWVVHNEMNTFGHTGMKAFEPYNSAEWANYPEAASWMMVHVYDHLDYTNDIAWWRAQGWPLLKGVASFWLDHLVEDLHFKDGTLVTAPCNSPEQAVITLGCAHSQQLVWQLFEAVEKGYSVSGDNDKAFLQGKSVQSKKLKLDKGIKIGSFGQLQEWKVEFDRPNDLHRHLSHLIGLYPGYVLTNFKSPTGKNQGLPQLTREQVLKAAEVSLISRGDGTGPDGDAGWEKVWRAACWAQLQNSTQFYHVLTYAFERNFASNLWSLYNPFAEDPIFQIDANLGYPAAVLNAVIQAPDTSSLSDALRVTLLPALPAAWGTGSIKGARIRGGITLDLSWAGGKAVRASLRVDPVVRYNRQVQVWYGKRLVAAFSATAGLKRDLTKLPIRAIHHPTKACMAELAENLAAATAALESALRSYVDACSAVHGFCKNNPPGQIPDTLVNHLIQGCTVSESHEKQFRIARAMFNQARNYSLPNFAINSLPSEILVRIFHLVVGPRPCGVRDYSGEKIKFPKYPDYLSHVCSGWRDLVLKTPTLWIHIDHVPYHSLSPAFDERAYEVAKRSEYLPLHLHIYEPAFLHEYDYGNLVEFLTKTSFAIQSFELVLSKNSGDFSTEYVEILETHFQNCTPGLFDELTLVNPAETAPTLLYPSSDTGDVGVDDIGVGLWLSVDEVFEQMLPLKILRLDGVYFPWIHPIYHNLVELRLTSSRKPGATITKLELNAILKSNPVLQVLHFGLKVLEDTESMVEPVALLPELRVLNLTSTEQDELGTVTSALAPSPRSLRFSIELKSRSLPPYGDDVLNFFLGSNITELQVVARDRQSYEKDIALVDKLLHPVPHVRELVLDGFRWPREFRPMQGPGERSSERDGPRLQVLYILNGGIYVETLQELVTRHTVKRIIFWRCSVWGAADIAHKNISVTEIRSALSEVCGDVCVTEGDQSPVEHWDW